MAIKVPKNWHPPMALAGSSPMNTPVNSPFAKTLNAARSAFRNDSVIKDFRNRLSNKPSFIGKVESIGKGAIKRTAAMQKAISRRTPRWVKPATKRLMSGGIYGGLALGAIAMVGIGIMRGAMNQATEVVNQRYIEDQRFARNITMMSRLGYSSGTSSMNRFNHTAGLSQALSANRHGRGGY